MIILLGVAILVIPFIIIGSLIQDKNELIKSHKKRK